MFPSFFTLLICVFSIHCALCQHPNASLLPEKCGEGKTNNRIISGKNAGLGEFPWMAMLLYTVPSIPNFGLRPACGGSLINSNYVLTAGHCIYVKNVELKAVRLGEYDDRTEKDCVKDICAPPAQQINVKKIIKHEKYNADQFDYDIALLRLEKNAEINDFVKPICISAVNLVKPSNVFQVAGWGFTNSTTKTSSNILMKVDLGHFSYSRCKNMFQNVRMTIKNESQICAKGEGFKDTCNGDSGGPLMVISDLKGSPRYYVAGITSFGSSVCGSRLPGIYTRVSAYYDWILSKLEP